ncbi:MAG TPA: hypothetical protein DCG54_14430, partial [Anaerolineae bacterium]|nr:hypothetical protein [Anaerolineae bacterium]
FGEAVDIGQRELTELRLEIDKPAVIISPLVSDIGLLDAIDVNKIASRGEIATLETLPALKHAVSWRARLMRSLLRR